MNARPNRATKRKFSTSTLTPTHECVPWLAASGPLAYTPEDPPDKDYFFLYNFILPEIFSLRMNLRKHRYFGVGFKDDARDVFKFWNNARAGRVSRLYCEAGTLTPINVTAPVAAFDHKLFGWEDPAVMLIQHGSYQSVRLEDQPEIADGVVYLYRGIQKTAEFRWMRFDAKTLERGDQEAWLAYLKTQAQVLSDSVLSFNSIHDRAVRCETEHINDRSRTTDEIARENGLAVDSEGFPGLLWDTHHQCFGLERWVAERKFGPNYVVGKTPLTNIRITTFFAGECEAKVIDPNRVEFFETVGCQRIESFPHRRVRRGTRWHERSGRGQSL